MNTRGWTIAAAAWVPLAALGSDIDANFAVLLDDQRIGEHRFAILGPPGARRVVSDARFAVKLLGLTVYRYRHQAQEQWRGDCLTALQSSTDDDGTPSRVDATEVGEALKVVTGSGTQALGGCVMSFAYWHPSMRQQTQLLNAQTGRYEPVRISRIGAGSVDVLGQPTAATRWRIDGPAQPVDVWYTAQGDWVGLDSTVGNGRRLSYRLVK